MKNRRWFYLFSEWHKEFGGFDIFQADSKGDGIFFDLINLEAPIISLNDDFVFEKVGE